ncbi:MAG: hypothetical protein ACYDHZ_00395 [Dehalococcoidia bacterium]
MTERTIQSPDVCGTVSSQEVSEAIRQVKNQTQEVIRSSQDKPQVGDWYVVSLRNLVDIDAEADRQIHVLDLIVAPCLSVEPHGRDYRVTFDMERTKQFKAKFPGQLFAKAGDVAKVLHDLAASLEGVK